MAHQWSISKDRDISRNIMIRRLKLKKLKIGTLVWLFNPTKNKGRSPRQRIKFEEKPYKVLGTLSDMVIKIETLDK